MLQCHEDFIRVLVPQPIVRKIDGGWEISGVPCFMGTAEYHIRREWLRKRLGRFKSVWRNSSGLWVGEIDIGE